MTETISKRIAHYLLKNGSIKNESDLDIYSYGLELLISSLFNIAAILILSFIFGKPLEAVAFFLAFIPLRIFAGGYHAKTHLNCFLILLTVYSINLAILQFIPYNYIFYSINIFTSCSIILVFLFSPVEDHNKPLTDEEKNDYRKISIRIILFQLAVIIGTLFFNKYLYIILSFCIGQLAAALSLLAVKIKNKRGNRDESIKDFIIKER